MKDIYMATISEVVRRSKVALENYYGDQLKGLILYGSKDLTFRGHHDFAASCEADAAQQQQEA
jgi:hypothetical protein